MFNQIIMHVDSNYYACQFELLYMSNQIIMHV